MEFANIIMWVIIVIAFLVVVAVIWYGVKHDPHTSIRSSESSRAVQTVQKQAEAAKRKLAAIREAEEKQDESAEPEKETTR